jgi:hypothetical protein
LLSKKDSDVISVVLGTELETLGARPAPADQAAATVKVTLSENPRSSVWVAEIHLGTASPSVVMVSIPRDSDSVGSRDSCAITLHKIPLWSQEDRILDVAVLDDEEATPRHIAVLDAEKVAIYRQLNGKWQVEHNFAIAHIRPWPQDLRGRLILAKDHLFDVYLPGVFCKTTTVPLALSCRESDDPWPLNSAPGVQTVGGFYSASRNFFTGALTPGIAKINNVGKFYSATSLPRPSYVLWLFSGVDGQTFFVDGVTEQPTKLNWGSDFVTVKTLCGMSWQVLATSASSAESSADSLRAYEIPDREPQPLSAPLDFPGHITALWPEAKGDTAIAIAKNEEAGKYEAFRVAVACGQ